MSGCLRIREMGGSWWSGLATFGRVIEGLLRFHRRGVNTWMFLAVTRWFDFFVRHDNISEDGFELSKMLTCRGVNDTSFLFPRTLDFFDAISHALEPPASLRSTQTDIQTLPADGGHGWIRLLFAKLQQFDPAKLDRMTLRLQRDVAVIQREAVFMDQLSGVRVAWV